VAAVAAIAPAPLLLAASMGVAHADYCSDIYAGQQVNGTPTGTVTASTDPTDGAAVGSPVSITLGSAHGTGTVLAVTMGKMRGWNFCNQTSPHWCAEG
jgi:hypothetical protein